MIVKHGAKEWSTLALNVRPTASPSIVIHARVAVRCATAIRIHRC